MNTRRDFLQKITASFIAIPFISEHELLKVENPVQQK